MWSLFMIWEMDLNPSASELLPNEFLYLKNMGKYMNKCENYGDFPTSIFKINLPKGNGKVLKFGHTVEIWLFQYISGVSMKGQK